MIKKKKKISRDRTINIIVSLMTTKLGTAALSLREKRIIVIYESIKYRCTRHRSYARCIICIREVA